ncbi:hypothetical protein [Thalassobacillus devorans]|uniref:hypothetical protein n=1 Tax=Thalassobacillus devorans TaxID=279813 RepID=UPI0020CAF1FC|nr:hypothetical protein [Thalassobacillus devorans]
MLLKHLINEIKSNLENKNYLSALALTLTLPDICAKISYPNMKGSGKRYKCWYNEYIYKYDKPKVGLDDLDSLTISGKIVYALRNLLLHEGSLDATEDIRKELGVKNSQSLKFVLSDSITSYSKAWSDGDKSTNPDIYIRISVVDFCKNICAVAENIFYETYQDKDIYNDIIILNN